MTQNMDQEITIWKFTVYINSVCSWVWQRRFQLVIMYCNTKLKLQDL